MASILSLKEESLAFSDVVCIDIKPEGQGFVKLSISNSQ